MWTRTNFSVACQPADLTSFSISQAHVPFLSFLVSCTICAQTSFFLLTIAAIGQRQGGDLTWLEPYWPAIQTWYKFLITLLPFPQEQLR